MFCYGADRKDPIRPPPVQIEYARRRLGRMAPLQRRAICVPLEIESLRWTLSLLAIEGVATMVRVSQLVSVALACGMLLVVVVATADEPKPEAAKPDATKSDADRAAMMVPTKIAGTYRGGELIELRVRDRLAYVVKPTGTVDAKKRWLW